MSIDPGHLGERVSELVDGVLGHDDRDRAYAHLTHCADCRAHVEEERAIKARLAGLPEPAFPPGLTARLLDIPGSAQTDLLAEATSLTPPAHATAAVQPRHDVRVATRGSTGPATRRGRTRPGPERPASSRGRRRVRLATASGGTILAGALAVAFLVGGGSSGRAVNPPVDQFTVEHAAVTKEVPLSGSSVTSAVTASFARNEAP
jgi:hypothetical protein